MNRLQPAVTATLWAGILGGTLDVGTAALIFNTSPVVILYAIASGLLGRAAFAGGVSIALLGLALQWAMSLLITAIYVYAAGRLSALNRRWWASGVAYGVVIYYVMNDVVRPLSAAWPRDSWDVPIDWLKFVENMAAMILYGLIIAFFAQRGVPAAAPARSEAGPA